MKIELIDYSKDAVNLWLRTKNTRLGFDKDPSTWTDSEKMEHLEYAKNTIKSSMEFVDYTFRISGVSRAFTHQFVRTRTGSYAQESQRTVDVRGSEFVVPESIVGNEEALLAWETADEAIRDAYSKMVDLGIPVGDARGILPTNVSTSIVAKFNLRTLSDMAKTRLCTRTQGEYQEVFKQMKKAVVEVHEWADDLLVVGCESQGSCIFPNYGPKSCPIYPATIPVELVRAKRIEIRKLFDETKFAANPIAKDGKAS
jgi:flavin-dependent thymidylate synthase